MKRTKNINHSSFRKSWSARHLTPVALAVTAVFMLAGCEKSDETVSLLLGEERNLNNRSGERNRCY